MSFWEKHRVDIISIQGMMSGIEIYEGLRQINQSYKEDKDERDLFVKEAMDIFKNNNVWKISKLSIKAISENNGEAWNELKEYFGKDADEKRIKSDLKFICEGLNIYLVHFPCLVKKYDYRTADKLSSLAHWSKHLLEGYETEEQLKVLSEWMKH